MATKKNVKLASNAIKMMSSYTRMDYAGRGGRMYIGLKSEAMDGTDIILPTDAYDGDKFFIVDSSETLIFYKGTWYKLS